MTPRRTLRQPIDGAAYDTWRQAAPEDVDDVPHSHARFCRCEGCQERRAEARADARDRGDR